VRRKNRDNLKEDGEKLLPCRKRLLQEKTTKRDQTLKAAAATERHGAGDKNPGWVKQRTVDADQVGGKGPQKGVPKSFCKRGGGGIKLPKKTPQGTEFRTWFGRPT